TSAFIGCKEAVKVVGKERVGPGVNIASIVGEMGNPGQTNYSAPKGGLNAMTKSFAKEAAPRGIRYNAVTPGCIQTGMTAVLKQEV
ncbi:SDR family NAD(P)-dependent oxidoreductase, partial [Aliarcobacter butzleri]